MPTRPRSATTSASVRRHRWKPASHGLLNGIGLATRFEELPVSVIYPVVLSGGSGSRLWPLSREFYPKQLLRLTGDQTLLQQTIQRLDGVNGATDPLVVCNEEHRFLVA